ncbi:uncharacterized protein LOC116846441 [Odontomachus brunneus]|uniref:uncharacterized protein LOC116846441 n=1 Tax=Odontomachus brunneus TaxID=486640 RepID=UPI0013F290AC|nr:uncharacterized protein LOC116846441 [Odontomachus brunneus]
MASASAYTAQGSPCVSSVTGWGFLQVLLSFVIIISFFFYSQSMDADHIREHRDNKITEKARRLKQPCTKWIVTSPSLSSLLLHHYLHIEEETDDMPIIDLVPEEEQDLG